MADPSASPSVPASSAPKIGGSEGAFIAIVVILSVVFLSACVGIFLLLRFWEPNHRERKRRRKFSIRRKGVTGSHPLPIGLHDPEAPVVGSLSDKLGNMFHGRRQGSGWVQAHDDDWDSADEEMTAVDHDRVSMGSAQGGKRTTIIVEPDDKSTVEGLSASPMQVTPSGTPRAVAYSDPFDDGPTGSPPRDDASAYYSASSMSSRDARGPSQGAPKFVDGATRFREDV